MNQQRDTEIERSRYDARARELLESGKLLSGDYDFLINCSPEHRNAFQKYYENILKNVKPGMKVLELGAGHGTHSTPPINGGGELWALDISDESLKILAKRYPFVRAVVGNMESIPLETSSFDVVLSAGSLSYGNLERVTNEIIRVLKPDGCLIVIDSLDGNPIYQVNRFFHYLRGNRTYSTLKNMPNWKSVNSLRARFQETEALFFGSWLWLFPILTLVIPSSVAIKIIDRVERALPLRKRAFKFVLVCKKLKHNN